MVLALLLSQALSRTRLADEDQVGVTLGSAMRLK